MNLTKKLYHLSVLTMIIFSLSGCFNKTLEPHEVQKAEKITINGTSYLPEYNGLDSYLLSEEELVLGNEEHWYIHNEKLYLFADEDTKESWFENITLITEAANKHWEVVTAPTEEEKFEDMTDAFMNGASY